MGVRVLLADDSAEMRWVLKAMLEAAPDVEVVGEAENGRTAVELTLALQPDVVVMDIVMPVMNGIAATRHIVEQAPQVKVLALTMYHDKRFVTEMFKAGASGYLLKDSAFEELVRAIRAVLAGERYVSPEVAACNGEAGSACENANH